MADRFPIVDADTHYAENLGGLHAYMDEPWSTQALESGIFKLLPGAGSGDREMGGRIDRSSRVMDTAGQDSQTVKADITSNMESLGLDALLLLPNYLAVISHLSVRDLAVAMCNAHIDYHLDQIADPSLGIYTMPIITWHDPEAAAETIERVAHHPAVVGVAVMNSYSNPPWGDQRYHVVYEAAQRHNLPLVFHASSGLSLIERAGTQDGFQRVIESHSMQFLTSNQVQLTSLVFQGVPVRYPDLKIVFLEAGLLWVPAMMYRLDEYFVKRRAEAPLLEDLPSEYIRKHFWFGTQPIERPPRDLMKAVFDACDGYNHFLFASDHPHWDYDEPIVVERLGFLSTEEKARVFAGNALSVFDFAKGGTQEWHSNALDRLKGYSPNQETADSVQARS